VGTPTRRIDGINFSSYIESTTFHPVSHAVVAGGASLKEARQAAIKRGVQRPLLMMVPESAGFFIGFGQTIEPSGR
jgi:hypothetical protein